jgi:uroporphyrinogen-III decarboxylase
MEGNSMDAKEWAKLAPAEKREARFKEATAAEGMPFASPEIKHAYEERMQMIKDVVDLKKPTRVPVCPFMGFFPFVHAGVTAQDAMYDYAKLGYAMKKYHKDFLPDSVSGAFLYGPGNVFEILDYKLYNWPGHGVNINSPYQAKESDYMKADEYDAFINDPSDFFLRRYLPRVFGSLAPWGMFGPFTDILELPFTGGSIVPFGIPPVQESFKKLLEAGTKALEWIQAAVAIDTDTICNLGIPPLMGGFTKAPFDIIGDTLRGTRAIMFDMYRQPKKLLAAIDRIVPLAIDLAVRGTTMNKNPIAFIPLHKGADGFMSNKDFNTFYWPSLKAVILGLVENGVVPYLFVEGGYNQRLDIIADPEIPKGTTIWMFDQTNMKEVKKHLGGWACFGGNVPASMIKAGTPEEVKQYVKVLINDVAQDGGFMLSTGAVLDEGKDENLHAMIEAGKQYGKY